MSTPINRTVGAKGPVWTSVRKRLFIIGAVVALSLWAIYPPRETIKLGLDLDGGVQLVLRVKTDDALQLQTHATVERLRSALTNARVAFSGLDVTSPAEFRVSGIDDPVGFRRVAAEAETAFDRLQRDGTHTFRIKPVAERDLARDTVDQALHTIERRVNELGVAEPVVQRYTEHDQILVQLPGVADVDRAKQIIKSTAQLRLTLIERGPFPERDAALHAYDNALPPALEVLPGPSDTQGTGTSAYYVVHKAPAASGNDLRDARQSLDEFNRPAVRFSLNEDAARRFGAFTERNIKPAFHIADRELVSAAIGEDLQWRGIYATVASIVAIAIYIGIRFRFSFAIGAIAATFHDMLVTLACLSFAGYDLSLNVTAALLTVIGYSVNDTIVIFDRVRENAKVLRGQSLAGVVNLSVNQTLSRTVITAGTTLLSVLSLYLFGGEALRGFAFTMLVGIVSGTYSTVFIASAIATLLSRRPPTRQAERYR